MKEQQAVALPPPAACANDNQTGTPETGFPVASTTITVKATCWLAERLLGGAIGAGVIWYEHVCTPAPIASAVDADPAAPELEAETVMIFVPAVL